MDKLNNYEQHQDNREITPINQARFLDRLEPEYEELWTELLTQANETKKTFDEVLFPIWLDEDYPLVIRDRVMLLSLGRHDIVKPLIGNWENGFRGEFVDGGLSYAHRSGYNQEYARWIDEAVEYGDVVSHSTLFGHAYTMFSSGAWDQDKFEAILDRFDPVDVEPQSYGGFWDDPGQRLDMWRLPYISDILSGVITRADDTRLYTWADEKYELYRENYLLNESVLPSWLQNLNGRKVMRFTFAELKYLDDASSITPNIMHALEVYGLDYTDDFRVNLTLLVKHLDDLSQPAIINLYDSLARRGARNYYDFSEEHQDLIFSRIIDVPESTLKLREGLMEARQKIINEINSHKEKEDAAEKERQDYNTKKRELAKSALEGYKNTATKFRHIS